MAIPHLLYIPRWYPSKEDPMLGLFVFKHAKAAIKAGYRVSVAYACPSKTKNSNKIYEVRVAKEGNLLEVIVAYKNISGIPGIFRQTRAWYKALKQVNKLKGNPDLIHAHVLTRTAVLAFLCGLRYRVPYLITEHWSRYYPENMQYRGVMRHFLTKLVLNYAGKVTVVSESLASAMKNCGLIFDPTILPNLVDTELFIPAHQKTNGIKKIVSITCFDEKSKNLFLLIDAFKLLCEQNKNIELVLIGEGQDLDITKQYATDSGLGSEKIIFTGKLENDELVKELQGAACLALSSNYETFAIVVFEALACGVPVVATDVADLSLHISPEMGKIAQKGDLTEFKNKLSEVLENSGQFSQEKMRKYVIDQFGNQAIIDKMKALYSPFFQNNDND
ncbi:MAG: glycosyltransferase [Lentimicrobium sp.]|nr:glycosyltransferase [Lentimicrobium sp.]